MLSFSDEIPLPEYDPVKERTLAALAAAFAFILRHLLARLLNAL